MASFDGRPGALPITVYYKGDFALQFSFTSGGSAYSLAGASATFVIYEKNGTAALSLSSGSGLTISGAAGTIDLAITNTQIVALSTQEYNYEFILTLSGGTVWPVLDSVFNISENGQASYSGDTVEVALDGGTVTMTIAAGSGGGTGNLSDGDTLTTGLTFPNTGLHILDTNATHGLILSPGSNLTADRTLTVTTGDTDRTLTISGNTTLGGGSHSGTNTGDQTITLSGDVTGSGMGAITATISALDAAKIADGTVSNTEFQYLNGVTSGVQAQIDGKAATSHTHAIGDVTGLQTALDGKVDENAAITGATKTKITYGANGLVTAGADATTADIADSSNKRYVTDAQLTVIGNTSGTNTGDQTDVTGNAGTVTVADAGGDTTTWVLLGTAQTGNLSPATDAGLTYNATTNALTATTFVGALTGNADTVTGFSGTSSGTNTGDQNTFSTIVVSGQSNVVAETTADTLTIAAGNNITITTDASADTITIAAGSVSSDTIWDAKGDLVAGTGADTAQKLTVGTDGSQLYADSSQPTGLRWAPSVISPTQLTADQDNYSPTGWAAAQIVRIDGDSSMRAITSMSAGYSGEVKQIINVGSYPVYFPGEHPDGTEANRILTGGIDHILLPGDCIDIHYDGTSSRWRIPVRRNETMYVKSIFYQASGGSSTSGDWGNLSFGGTSVGASVSPRNWALSTLTSTTGASYIGFSKTITDIASFGSSHMYFQAMLSLDNLSTGTETYEFDFSITSDITAFPYANNSTGIRYTHSVNSGKFQMYSKDSGGSVAVADTGVTVTAGELYGFRIDFDKSRTELRGYINNTPIGRLASGLPSAGDAGVRIAINKSAGSTARVARVYSLASCFIFP